MPRYSGITYVEGFEPASVEPVELVPDLCYGDAKPYDVGHERAIANALNVLIDYKTAHQSPFLWNDVETLSLPANSSLGTVTFFFGPVFLGLENLGATVTRSLTVAPHFRSIAGGDAYIRVTLSRMIPQHGPSKDSSTPILDCGPYGDPAFGDYASQTSEWSTTSTTWATGSDKTLDVAVKDLYYGYAWLTIEGSGDVECRGLGKCILGPRTT